MLRRIRLTPLARLVAVSSAILLMLTGVSYALFKSNDVMIQGSTISSATARLLLSGNGTTYSDTLPGFAFLGVEPGGAPSPQPGYQVYFKNEGTSALALNISLSTALANPQNARLDHVFLVVTPASGGQSTRLSLASLYDAYAGGRSVSMNAQLPPGQVGRYLLQIEMEPTAVASAQGTVTLNVVDFFFVGMAVNG
ncbi:MAG: hypothetical protein JWN82_502 [Candidatus Saccharibacteria bacterium]|nr:hypothetical protein [Candidatus Saccharibacteria bacterium]